MAFIALKIKQENHIITLRDAEKNQLIKLNAN